MMTPREEEEEGVCHPLKHAKRGGGGGGGGLMIDEIDAWLRGTKELHALGRPAIPWLQTLLLKKE
jgi:hypothetical protein